MDDSVSTAENKPPVKDRSLEKAGLSYIVADAAQIAANLSEQTPNYAGAIAAAGWMAGGVAAEHYGHPSAEQQLRHFSLELGDYLKSQPIDPARAEAGDLRPKGVIAHAEDFLYRYPSQSLNAIYGLLAGNMLRQGLFPSAKMLATPDLKAHHILLQYTIPGAMILSGALAGLLLPDHGKPKDESQRRHGVFGHALDWAEENPLRVSGAVYTTNNLLGIGEASMRALKEPFNPSYMAKMAAAATYIYANHQLTQSSKGGHDSRVDPGTMAALADRSAALMRKLPPLEREAMIDRVSGFLASRKDMTYSSAEINALVHRKLAERETAAPKTWVDKTAALPVGVETSRR